MIKKFTLFFGLLLTTSALMSQVVFESNFSDWDNELPNDWVGTKTNLPNDSINEITSGVVYGTSAARIENASGSHKRFTTQPMAVEETTNYLIKFWARGDGQLRTGIFDDRTSGNGYAYNDYLTINTPEWDQFSQAIVAAQNYDEAEFILSIRNTIEASNNIELDSLSIEEFDYTIPVASIYDIQFTTDADGMSDLNGQPVETRGVVTGVKDPDGFFIQNGEGMWTGIYVFDHGNNEVARGDSVLIQATVSEYQGLTELVDVITFENLSSGNTLPAPAEITTSDANSEGFEGVLVRVTEADCTDPDPGFGQFIVDDGSGEIYIDDDMYGYNAQMDFTYRITGVGFYSFDNYKILPRDENDIELLEGSFDEVSIYDIQFTEDAGGESPYNNQTVITGGVVTAVGDDGYFIQNNSGMWQGIYVFDNENTPARGDSVTFTAGVTEFFSMTELENLSGFSNVSSGNPLPAALERNTGEISEEGLEGVLTAVTEGECTEQANEFNEFKIDDGSGNAIVDDRLYLYTAMLGNSYDVTGIVFFGNGEFKLNPRDENDVFDNGPVGLEETGAYPTASIYPNPASKTLTLNLGKLSGKVEMRVVNIAGKVIIDEHLSSVTRSIDVSSLASGQYQIILEGTEGKRALRLIVR